MWLGMRISLPSGHGELLIKETELKLRLCNCNFSYFLYVPSLYIGEVMERSTHFNIQRLFHGAQTSVSC